MTVIIIIIILTLRTHGNFTGGIVYNMIYSAKRWIFVFKCTQRSISHAKQVLEFYTETTLIMGNEDMWTSLDVFLGKLIWVSSDDYVCIQNLNQ